MDQATAPGPRLHGRVVRAALHREKGPRGASPGSQPTSIRALRAPPPSNPSASASSPRASQAQAETNKRWHLLFLARFYFGPTTSASPCLCSFVRAVAPHHTTLHHPTPTRGCLLRRTSNRATARLDSLYTTASRRPNPLLAPLHIPIQFLISVSVPVHHIPNKTL